MSRLQKSRVVIKKAVEGCACKNMGILSAGLHYQFQRNLQREKNYWA
jgi:hypothetical protein